MGADAGPDQRPADLSCDALGQRNVPSRGLWVAAAKVQPLHTLTLARRTDIPTVDGHPDATTDTNHNADLLLGGPALLVALTQQPIEQHPAFVALNADPGSAFGLDREFDGLAGHGGHRGALLGRDARGRLGRGRGPRDLLGGALLAPTTVPDKLHDPVDHHEGEGERHRGAPVRGAALTE